MQQRATYCEEVAVRQEPAATKPATAEARPVPAAEVPDPMGATGVEHELEMAARDRPVPEADRAVRGAPELEPGPGEQEDGARVRARDAHQRGGCRGDRRPSWLEQ